MKRCAVAYELAPVRPAPSRAATLPPPGLLRRPLPVAPDALVDLSELPGLDLPLSHTPSGAFAFSSCISDTQSSLRWPPMRLASLQRGMILCH